MLFLIIVNLFFLKKIQWELHLRCQHKAYFYFSINWNNTLNYMIVIINAFNGRIFSKIDNETN